MAAKFKKYTILVVVCLVCFFGCEEFFRRRIGGFAGSYPFAETWAINAPEVEIVQAVKELKAEDGSLRPPNEVAVNYKREGETVVEIPDTVTNNKLDSSSLSYYLKSAKDTTVPVNAYPNYWLDINFYYADTKEIVQAWTRPSDDSNVTVLAFVSLIDDDLYAIEPRLINRDFWYGANRYQIQKFKTKVVDRIQHKIDEIRQRNQ